MNKTELIRNYGVRFTEPFAGTIEISIPDWKLRRVRNLIRVSKQQSRLSVATPGRGGTFRLSYQYAFNFPAVGFGLKSIERRLRDLHYGMKEFTASNVMIEITASAINESRKMVR